MFECYARLSGGRVVAGVESSVLPRILSECAQRICTQSCYSHTHLTVLVASLSRMVHLQGSPITTPNRPCSL